MKCDPKIEAVYHLLLKRDGALFDVWKALKKLLCRMTRNEISEYYEEHLRATTEEFYKLRIDRDKVYGQRKNHSGEKLWVIYARNRKYHMMSFAKDADKKEPTFRKSGRGGKVENPSENTLIFEFPPRVGREDLVSQISALLTRYDRDIVREAVKLANV